MLIEILKFSKLNSIENYTVVTICMSFSCLLSFGVLSYISTAMCYEALLTVS